MAEAQPVEEEAGRADEAPTRARQDSSVGARVMRARILSTNLDRKVVALQAGWVALAAFVLLVALLFWFARTSIVAAVPQTALLYEALGIPVAGGPPAEGLSRLSMREDRFETEYEKIDGERVLVIRGVIANPLDEDVALPPLKAVLLDKAGKEVEAWTFNVDKKTLAAGSEVAFETSTRKPPEEARNARVLFVMEAE